MSPAPSPPPMDPALAQIATALIGAVAGFIAAKFGVKAKKAEKQPELQAQINQGVTDLITHYIKALEVEKARYADHLAEMDEKIERMQTRIDHLEQTLRAAGVPIPPQRED